MKELVLLASLLIPARVAAAVAPEKPKQDPNYAGAYVPLVDYDLDCSDIGATVYVVGLDHHGLDGDGDGIGCESY